MLFSEVYSAYFNTVGEIIKQSLLGEISEKRIHEIIKEMAFSESDLTITSAIETEEWLILNDELKTPLKQSPKMPLTTLQKRWLKALLSDPKIQLFSPDETGLEDVTPLFNSEDFVFFDRCLDSDPYQDESYIKHFKTILSALDDRKQLEINFYNRNGEHRQGTYTPHHLEYSAKDDKFRLATSAGFVNLARITQCTSLDAISPTDKPYHEKEDWVVFNLIDQRGALDRVLLHFSDLRKETRQTGEDTYEVTLWYDAHDRTELVIRLIAYGPLIRVTQPENMIVLLKQRLLKQQNLWEKSTI
jgi:hypothetical protein